jgi:hypothetical protein
MPATREERALRSGDADGELAVGQEVREGKRGWRSEGANCTRAMWERRGRGE